MTDLEKKSQELFGLYEKLDEVDEEADQVQSTDLAAGKKSGNPAKKSG